MSNNSVQLHFATNMSTAQTSEHTYPAEMKENILQLKRSYDH